MKKKICKALSVLCLSFLVACSTMHKRAESFMEKGAYEEAVATYEEILKKDPTDADAVEGLRKSREKYIDKRLIDVRMARMAGDYKAATDMLLQVVTKERDWGYAPGGAAAYSQSEEAGYATHFVDKEVQASMTDKKPLLGAWWLTKYGAIYASASPAAHAALFTKVRAAGKASCSKYQDGTLTGLRYYMDFLNRYCGYWGEGVETGSRKIGNPPNPLVKEVLFTTQITNLNPKLVPILESRLRERFRGLAWYDAAGETKLPMLLKGDYRYVYSTRPVTLSHSYKVKEAYTDYRRVTRSREIASTVPGQPARKETYEDTEPVTRFHDVPKTYNYQATEHSQDLGVSFGGEAQLAGTKVSFNYSGSDRKVETEHSNRMPDIGLMPKSASLFSEEAWMQSQAEKAADVMAKDAAELWISLYCKMPEGEMSFARTGDAVQKCLRQALPNPPGFADQWYKANIGLSVTDTYSLYANKVR